MPRISQIKIVTGAISTTVVTLSRNMDTTVVTVPSKTSSRTGRPRETRPAHTARNWKKPVGSSSATRIIIPSSSPRVLKSMAAIAWVSL